MGNGLIRLAAFALLTGFLGILLWHVPRLDLGVVIAITLLCAGYDMLTAGRPRGPS